MNLYTRLINKDHPLPPDYVPENLTDIGIPFDAPCGDPKRLLEIRTAHAALTLIQAAQKESLIITESPATAPTNASSSFPPEILMLHLQAPASTRVALHWMSHVRRSNISSSRNLPKHQRENGSNETLLSTVLLSAILQTKNPSPASPGNPGISVM